MNENELKQITTTSASTHHFPSSTHTMMVHEVHVHKLANNCCKVAEAQYKIFLKSAYQKYEKRGFFEHFNL